MIRTLPCAFIVLLVLSGCAPIDDGPTGEDGPVGKADSFESSHPINMPAAIYGESVFDVPMVGESYGDQGPTLFLLSAIHGDESSAVTYGERLRTMLLGGLAERHGIRIFFVQSANPDGVSEYMRENLNFVDLNRNFPAENFDAGGTGGDVPLSEPESRMLHAALNATGPVGVVSIHCCIPTFDLDGPSIGLARSMHDAMYENSGFEYEFEDLPAYGGSMGSYVSQILGKPIVTVEFAPGEMMPVLQQLAGMDHSIEAAAAWTAEQEPAVPFDIDALEPLDAAGQYDAFELGRSAADLPIRAELIGGGDRHTLLLSGLSGETRRASYLAEYVRRLKIAQMSEFSRSRLLAITGANPDGLGSGTAENAAFVDIRAEFASPSVSAPEITAVRDAIAAHAPELAVVLVDSERDAVSVLGAPASDEVVEDLAALELSDPPNDTGWLQPVLDTGATVVLVEVASEYAETQAWELDFTPEFQSQSVVGEPLSDILQ